MANNLKTEFNAARHRLEALETRREVLCREQISAASAQRDLWLSDNADEKSLTRAAQRLSTAEATLSGLDSALVAVREKIAQLTTDLTMAEDVEQREQKARQAEGQIPVIDEAFAETQAATKKLIAALRASPEIPEAEAAARWVEEFATPLQPEITRIRGMHADRARILRSTPTPPVKPPPQPVPTLRPQPERLGDLREDPRRFVDWNSPEVMRQR